MQQQTDSKPQIKHLPTLFHMSGVSQRSMSFPQGTKTQIKKIEHVPAAIEIKAGTVLYHGTKKQYVGSILQGIKTRKNINDLESVLTGEDKLQGKGIFYTTPSKMGALEWATNDNLEIEKFTNPKALKKHLLDNYSVIELKKENGSHPSYYKQGSIPDSKVLVGTDEEVNKGFLRSEIDMGPLVDQYITKLGLDSVQLQQESLPTMNESCELVKEIIAQKPLKFPQGSDDLHHKLLEQKMTEIEHNKYRKIQKTILGVGPRELESVGEANMGSAKRSQQRTVKPLVNKAKKLWIR